MCGESVSFGPLWDVEVCERERYGSKFGQNRRKKTRHALGHSREGGR